MDLQSLQIIAGIALAAVTVLGTIFGWFKKLRTWYAAHFGTPDSASVPRKTLILLPAPRSNALWWHMGSMNEKPAMQIVGDLKLTNITSLSIFLNGARLRKPKTIGNAFVRQHRSNMHGPDYAIPAQSVTELRFDFFVQPPVSKVGETFIADVAIVDNFGNEHWLKKLEFKYM